MSKTVVAPAYDIPFDSIVNNPEGFFAFMVEFVGFAVMGAVVGSSIDSGFTWLYRAIAGETAEERRVVWARVLCGTLQIIFNGLFIYVLWKYIYRSFAEHFQYSMTGMAFPACMFGTQWGITYAMQSILPYPKIVY